MPYSKDHKAQSREKILHSAYQLFSQRGFTAITVDLVMQQAGLTRGAFYNHFKSKAELYSAAITFGAQQSPAVEQKPTAMSERDWVASLLENYLSAEHVQGGRACPLAFMATDIALQSEAAKQAYAQAFSGINDILYRRVNSYASLSCDQLSAATVLMVGAVAIARTMELNAAQQLLGSCRAQVKVLLSL